jgi:hypothetical protein
MKTRLALSRRTRFPAILPFALLGSAALVATAAAFAAGPGIPTTGADVTINRLTGVGEYGLADGFRGYAVGTTSCNIGDTPVNWCDNGGGCTDGVIQLTDDQHPVIAQGIYRLYNGRLEQIGMSWLKHGFLSTNSNEAQCKNGTPSCIGPPLGGSQLGVGCTDTYGSGLNGSRPLGLRSEVNATTGVFPFPYTTVSSGAVYEQRIKILETDLDADFFAGASYWAEGQYIADNDATSGNSLNNASYQPVTVNQSDFDISMTGSLVRERTAIHAWKAADAAVEMYNIDFPGGIVERFELARKVSQVDGDTWHYEYAIRNMNSDRAARAFAVDFADGTPITNAGFKDVPHHSGEPYSTSDWDSAVTQETGTVGWATATFDSDPNANALRWATMFNFWFDADAAPGAEVHTLTLFKPSISADLTFRMPVFADGFEAHNLVAWSETQTGPEVP